MTATELFKSGRLSDAIAAQLKEVKAAPADQGKRLFLFELFAFAGDLERARKQIEAVTYNDMELDAAVQSYRRLLDAEEARRRLFRDGLQPKFFGEPPEHVRQRLEAVNRLRENNAAAAAELVRQANAAAAPLAGTLNDKPFDVLRDCDDLFAPVLEVIAPGGYYWVPLNAIESVSLEAPRYPRDVLWPSARLELRDGSGGAVYLPALYPGSHEHPDDSVRLGRATDWKESAGGLVRGLGLRTFLVGDDPVSLLDWRRLEATTPTP